MEITNHYHNASGGLRLMFIGQILMLVGLVLIWVPLLGSLLTIAGGVVEIVGLYRAGNDDQGYRTAMIFQLIGVVVNVVAGFLDEGILNSILSLASDVLGLMVVVQVCTTTGLLLHSVGNEALSQRGSTVIKLYVACTVVSIVCGVLSVIPVVNIVAGLVSVVAAIAQVVGYVLYLMFLYGSSKAL